MMPRSLFALSVASLTLLTGCDAPTTVNVPPPTILRESITQQGERGLKQRQAEFLNRIRAADSQQKTIDRALLNEQNELGLILDRSVEMDKIPALMKTMLVQMAKEFPGNDLTVLAYTPSQPPSKIGTAHFDAGTRDMTYTPEH